MYVTIKMAPFNELISKLPIEIREHILSFVDDISLIPDGLSDGFWKKLFLKKGLYRVMFASWKKSAKIIQDYSHLEEKRKILAVLDWEYMYVGTLVDIVIKKEFAEYKMQDEVIAAAGRAGLCMLVKPANMEDESYLDITPYGSILKNHYSGEFTFTDYESFVERSKKGVFQLNPGTSAWFWYHGCLNTNFSRVAQSLFKLYNIEYNLRHLNEDENSDCCVKDEYGHNVVGEYKHVDDDDDENEALRDKYEISCFPVLSRSLVYTKDPNVFDKPHVIEMFYKNNDICTVRDEDGNLKAFIVCIPTEEELEKMRCKKVGLCYFITDSGNIYFEQSDIYDEYMNWLL